MKLFQFVLCALAYQASYQASVKDRIVFGDEVIEKQIRYQVQLVIMMKHTKNSNFNIMGDCGGSLISSKHVLTAQHCLKDHEEWFPGTVAMAFGSIYSKKKELEWSLRHRRQIYENIQVCSNCWSPYPSYNSTNCYGDIAIIYLPQPVKFTDTIYPVRLPSWSDVESELIGKTALATGWGVTEHNRLSPTLLYTNFTIADRFMCKNPDVSEGHICTIRNSIKTPSTCNGDSGGPVVVDNKQVGIVSYGQIQDCLDSKYEAYTSIIYFLRWISKNTGIRIDN